MLRKRGLPARPSVFVSELGEVSALLAASLRQPVIHNPVRDPHGPLAVRAFLLCDKQCAPSIGLDGTIETPRWSTARWTTNIATGAPGAISLLSVATASRASLPIAHVDSVAQFVRRRKRRAGRNGRRVAARP